MRTPTNDRFIWLRTGLSLALFFLPAATLAQQEPPPALVVTHPVERETITEDLELLGTVQPVLDSLVASEVDGRVAARAVENGDRVSRGEVLVRLDAERLEKDLERLLAEQDEAQAELELALIQQRRAEDLYRQQVLSKGELDEALARRQSLEGRVEAAAARIASIEHDIERTSIRAPFTGVVTEVHTELGEWIDRGDPVVRMSNLDTVDIRLEVPERYYPQLARGDAAPATVDAIPGLTLEGHIFAIVPQADPGARTFPVLVRASNPKRRVGAGMLARVRLALGTADMALVVPKDAIVRQAQHELVFIVESDTVKAVTIRTGRAVDSRVEVTGELDAGDLVVVRGNERLAPGQKVQIVSELETTAMSEQR
ncbi:MAG: efflux RND transporter periplasmic adaptor subunit [Acidobacteriota bacterium]|nr:MAG: efflux RND transporter periplasmic adaptor subunit [Acidobacteriota bacterium]